MTLDALNRIDPAEVVASLRESLLVLTDELVVEYANERFFAVFDVDEAETIGAPLAKLGNGQWNIPSLIGELGRILDEKTIVEDFEVEHVFEHIGRRVMRLNARKTVRPGNGSRRILVAIEDVTLEHDMAADLERQRLLATGIVDTIREPLLVLDEELRVTGASRAFFSTFHVDATVTLGRKLTDLGNGQWANPALVELLLDVVPKNTVVEDHEVRHRFPEIGERVILLNARKVYREGNNTHSLLLAMEDVTERRRLEAERQAALDHAGRLLEELNHRVMNSLTMIGGIIALETRAMTDDDCRKAFARMRARVDAVGNLYRTLSQTGSIDSVMASVYLPTLIEDLVGSSGHGDRVSLDYAIADAALSTQIAVPLGLIVNELVTNSLKYAYGDRTGGRLTVELSIGDGTMNLRVADDGPGIDPQARVDSGLGQKLTNAFAMQLGGELVTDSASTGTVHRLSIPI